MPSAWQDAWRKTYRAPPNGSSPNGYIRKEDENKSEEKKQERKQEGTEQLRSRRRSRKETEETRSASDLLLPNNSISDLRVAKGSTRHASKTRYLHSPAMHGDAAETRVERQFLKLREPSVTGDHQRNAAHKHLIGVAVGC